MKSLTPQGFNYCFKTSKCKTWSRFICKM